MANQPLNLDTLPAQTYILSNLRLAFYNAPTTRDSGHPHFSQTPSLVPLPVHPDLPSDCSANASPPWHPPMATSPGGQTFDPSGSQPLSISLSGGHAYGPWAPAPGPHAIESTFSTFVQQIQLALRPGSPRQRPGTALWVLHSRPQTVPHWGRELTLTRCCLSLYLSVSPWGLSRLQLHS